MPSPATTTSYGATGSPAEGFYVEQEYADGFISLWRTPNSTRPGEAANGIIRTVAPFNVAGTVQFKDGTTNLGGPVRVTGGFAFGPFTIPPPSPHSLTATFTPADPAAFGPSTSNTVAFTF